MATLRHSITETWTNGSLTLTVTVSPTATGEDNREIAIPASTTNEQVALAFVVAKVQSLYLVCDQNITIKTNSTSSPGNTITLTANIPLVWYFGSPLANPFTVDVTTIYVTNAGTSTANLSTRMLINAT